MDSIISELVSRFERGVLTRRQLIQGLTALVAAGGPSAASAAQSGGLTATGIDHASVLVTDLQRSAEFYQRVFGLRPVSETSPIESFDWEPAEPLCRSGSRTLPA